MLLLPKELVADKSIWEAREKLMSSIYEKMPSFALHEMLKTEYNCRQLPDQAPEDPTNPDADKGYTYYINARGQMFSVPPPNEGEAYSRSMIETIMDRGQLNRIVELKPRKDTEEDKNAG